MSDIEGDSAKHRDRSPSFPAVGIAKAVEQTRKLFEKARRHEARMVDAAVDWGFSPQSSSTVRTVAALIAYGLIEPVSGADVRKIKVSETGWRILEDSRPGVHEKLVAEAAIKPKLIAQYAELWRGGRPDDSHAISQLKFESGLTPEAANRFLRVFDENIGFIKTSISNKEADKEEGPEGTAPEQKQSSRTADVDRYSPLGRHPAVPQTKVAAMEGERELTTGLLSKGASFRLIVSGKIGEKEIERLIRKLQLDKEILAEQEDPPENYVRPDDDDLDDI